MENCSFDVEVIESLNLLKPPVKRNPPNKIKDFSVNNFLLLRDFRHMFTAKHTKPCKHQINRDSSTSLVLKRTSETQIFNQCSAVSYTRLHCSGQRTVEEIKQHDNKGRPLIKVTVIPKSELNPGPCSNNKRLRKKIIVPKTLQTISSNHENSVQTKNVYVVVAGRKKDKIYELKTTSSANIEKKSSKDEFINNIPNFKKLIKTLNMESKRKKNNKKFTKLQRNEPQASETVPSVEHKCTCAQAPDDASPDVRAGRSRVRIVGRIGLNDDDKYVLRCHATVDEKPVPLSLSSAEMQLSSSMLGHDGSMTGQRDSMLQTDFQNNTVNELLLNICNMNRISKESQSTQVNFNNKPNQINLNTTSTFCTEQVTRCNCTHDEYPFKERVKTEYEGKNLKTCQSPLVIISVFPKQDNNLAELVKTVKCSHIESISDTLPENNKNNKTSEAKLLQKIARGRSPSPKSKKIKSKEDKILDNVRNESPLRMKPPTRYQKQGKNFPKQTLQSCNPNKGKEVSVNERKPKPRSLRTKSPQATPIEREPQKNFNTLRQSLKQQSPKPKLPKRNVDTGMNTEHLKIKKALVDSYTKDISGQISKKKHKPLKTMSQVSVNIGKDHCDVYLRQGGLAADLNVRKTMKEASVQKFSNEHEKHGSMESGYPFMCQIQPRSGYRSISENQSNDVNSIINNTPRLIPRDSLEMSHRHENNHIPQTSRPNELIANTDDMEFATIKHFTGDNCTIGDPVARDREIRILLGVADRRPKSILNEQQTQVFASGDQISCNCFYPTKERKNTFVNDFCLALNEDVVLFPCIEETRKYHGGCAAAAAHPDDVAGDQSLLNYLSKYSMNSTKYVDDGNFLHAKKYFQQHKKMNINIETEQKQNSQFKMVNSSTQYDGPYSKETFVYKQLIVNSKVDDCSQANKKTKQKPIVLTKGQYNKIKRKIQNTTSDKRKSKRCVYSRSIVSVGKVKLKPKGVHVYSNKEVQKYTPRKHYKPKQDFLVYPNKDVQKKTNRKHHKPEQDFLVYPNKEVQKDTPRKHYKPKQDFLVYPNKEVQNDTHRKHFKPKQDFPDYPNTEVQNDAPRKHFKHKQDFLVCSNKEVQNDTHHRTKQDALIYSNKEVKYDTYRKYGTPISGEEEIPGKSKKRSSKQKYKDPIETVVLFSNEARGSVKDKKPQNISARQTASSIEIRYTSVAYLKRVTYSSTNVGSIGSSSFANRNQISIKTLFRGHKKSLTPNLGTSGISLADGNISECQSMKLSPDAKTKKPFLKRLMSCLVMRSASKVETEPEVSQPPSVNSSIDSYHISTSYGAIEMTSSIYDTSDSFYSEHSIHPLSSKLKRGFLNSVRGFLTSRKS